MTKEELREELEIVAHEIVKLPQDAAWGAEGYSHENGIPRLGDEHETDARLANEAAKARRKKLNERREDIENELQRRLDEERAITRQSALDAATPEEKTNEELAYEISRSLQPENFEADPYSGKKVILKEGPWTITFHRTQEEIDMGETEPRDSLTIEKNGTLVATITDSGNLEEMSGSASDLRDAMILASRAVKR